VNKIVYWRGEEPFVRPVHTTKFAKYNNLAKSLANQCPDALFIVVVTNIWGYSESNYATIYDVPKLTKYLKK